MFLIPRGVTLMSEPTDPWYTRYTTPIWLLTAFYVYPATAVGTLVGARAMSPGWVLIVLLALDNLGMNVTTLIAGLGIGGVAVALAAQNILGDLFASFSIVMDRPFVVGDSLGIDTFTGTVDQHLKSGRLKALAHSGARASPILAGIPTIAESGFPGFEVLTWSGVVAPAGTPPLIVERLHREIVRILQLPDVRDVFIAQGAEPVGNTPAAFAAEIKASMARWEPVIKAAGIRVE